MVVDARQIGNWFVRRAAADSRTLSIMSLLKLMYIAHGWHLEIYKTPFFGNKIEAWKFGPVVPEAYYAYRQQGVNVSHELPCDGVPLSESQKKLLEEVYQIYSRMDAFKLSEITHVKGGPWEMASRQGYYAPISDSMIQSHYESLRANAVKSG